MPVHFFRKSDTSFQINCHSAMTVCILLSFCKRNEERNFVYTIYMLRAINGVIAVSVMEQDVKFKVL